MTRTCLIQHPHLVLQGQLNIDGVNQSVNMTSNNDGWNYDGRRKSATGSSITASLDPGTMSAYFLSVKHLWRNIT